MAREHTVDGLPVHPIGTDNSDLEEIAKEAELPFDEQIRRIATQSADFARAVDSYSRPPIPLTPDQMAMSLLFAEGMVWMHHMLEGAAYSEPSETLLSPSLDAIEDTRARSATVGCEAFLREGRERLGKENLGISGPLSFVLICLARGGLILLDRLNMAHI